MRDTLPQEKEKSNLSITPAVNISVLWRFLTKKKLMVMVFCLVVSIVSLEVSTYGDPTIVGDSIHNNNSNSVSVILAVDIGLKPIDFIDFCAQGDIDTVKKFLTKGVNIEKEIHGHTALMGCSAFLSDCL